jgi:hypothetical protein
MEERAFLWGELEGGGAGGGADDEWGGGMGVVEKAGVADEEFLAGKVEYLDVVG